MSNWTAAVAALATGPSLWWRLGEASGTSLADASGNSHSGALSGSTITYGITGPLAGDTDTAMSFTGTNPVGQVAYGAWAENGVFSCSFWFKAGTLASSNIIVARDHQSNGRRFQVQINSSGQLLFLTIQSTGSTVTITSPGSYNDGQWHLVTVTHDQALTTARRKMYVDGSSTPVAVSGTDGGSLSTAFTSPGVPFSVGNATRNTQAPANCSIDEVLYWGGYAVTGAEHLSLWTGGTTAPPGVPTSVSATPSATSISLTWSAPSGGGTVTGYETRIDGGAASSATSPKSFTGLTPSTSYTVSVRAVGPGGNSAWVDVTTSTTAAAPGVPTSVTATPDFTAITLTWAAPSSGGTPTGYDVRIDGGASTDVGNVLTYDFTGLTPGTSHTLEVRAHNGSGSSSWVSVTADTLTPLPPGIPDNVTAMPGARKIILTWDPPTTGDDPTSYDVRIDSGSATDVALAETHTFTGLTLTTSYTVSVRAVNAAGSSAWVDVDTTTLDGLALPAARTLRVEAEDRVYRIDPETRTLRIPAEDRTLYATPRGER